MTVLFYTVRSPMLLIRCRRFLQHKVWSVLQPLLSLCYARTRLAASLLSSSHRSDAGAFPGSRLPFDFDLGELLVEAHDGTVVAITHAVHFQRLHDLHDCGRERQRHTDAVGGVQDVAHVLDVQVDAEPGIEL